MGSIPQAVSTAMRCDSNSVGTPKSRTRSTCPVWTHPTFSIRFPTADLRIAWAGRVMVGCDLSARSALSRRRKSCARIRHRSIVPTRPTTVPAVRLHEPVSPVFGRQVGDSRARRWVTRLTVTVRAPGSGAIRSSRNLVSAKGPGGWWRKWPRILPVSRTRPAARRVTTFEQPVGKVASGQQFRNRYVDRAGAGIEIAVAVAVAGVEAFRAVFAAIRVGIRAHHRVHERREQVRARRGELLGARGVRVDTLDIGRRANTSLVDSVRR